MQVSSAFNEGFRAVFAGLFEQDNPYRDGTHLSREWQYGFEMGQGAQAEGYKLSELEGE